MMVALRKDPEQIDEEVRKTHSIRTDEDGNVCSFVLLTRYRSNMIVCFCLRYALSLTMVSLGRSTSCPRSADRCRRQCVSDSLSGTSEVWQRQKTPRDCDPERGRVNEDADSPGSLLIANSWRA